MLEVQFHIYCQDTECHWRREGTTVGCYHLLEQLHLISLDLSFEKVCITDCVKHDFLQAFFRRSNENLIALHCSQMVVLFCRKLMAQFGLIWAERIKGPESHCRPSCCLEDTISLPCLWCTMILVWLIYLVVVWGCSKKKVTIDPTVVKNLSDSFGILLVIIGFPLMVQEICFVNHSVGF